MKNKNAKVLIVDDNCAQLIALTLWLSKFSQLQVYGHMSGGRLDDGNKAKFARDYDLIIFTLQIDETNELPIDLVLALAMIRKAKEEHNKPAIIVLANGLAEQRANNAYRLVNQQLLRESDSQVYLTDSLLDLHREIDRLLAYRKAISNLSAKAG